MSKLHTVVGIDPGLSGAVAVVLFEGARPRRCDWIDMPVREITPGMTAGSKTFRLIDCSRLYWELASFLREYAALPATAWLEQVSAMPGQGVSSTFQFGRGFGSVESLLAVLELPVSYVRPSTWKWVMGLESAKSAALISARESLTSFGLDCSDLARALDDGRAEAYLIALYGAEQAQRRKA